MLLNILTRGSALAFVLAMSCTATAEINWREDLQKAHAEATQSGKPILLHFYGDNCPWCDKLEAGAFKSAEVAQAIDQGFIPVKVHTGRNQNLVQMFKVRQIPTDVVVTPSGQVVSHGTSKQSPKDFVAVLNQSLQSLRTPDTAIAATNSPQAPPTAPAAQPTAPAAQPTTQAVAAVVAPVVPPTSPTATAAAPASAPTTTANTMGMPAGFDAKTSGQLVGNRTENMSLAPPTASTPSPAVVTATKPSADAEQGAQSPQPELALEGFCPVTLATEMKWTEGKPEHGVIHLGRLYLFANAEAMKTFLADPEPFTPMLNEIDVVRFFEERVIVPGKRTHGTVVNNRLFFFHDEEALNHFNAEWERYFDAAIQVMDTAIHESNPRG